MTLAIFDLDNTLLAGDSDHLWGEFLVEKKLVDASYYEQSNSQFYQDYQNGTLDIAAYLAFCLQPLIGIQTEQLHSLHAQFLAEKIQPIILPKGQATIEQHRRSGDDLLIMTATNRFIAEPIAQTFNIDAILSTDIEMINGQITGRGQGVPCYQQGKVTQLHAWLQATNKPLDDSYFYSDSHNDLPLLGVVSHPIAVDPDEHLRQHAEINQWPIISFRE